MKHIVLWLLVTLAVLVIVFCVAVYASTFHPAEVQAEPITCPGEAPKLQRGQGLKIITFNVQFMAGRGYVFFFDVLNNAGPDERPAPESIRTTLAEVARIISDENADIVLLQEVDDGAKRTDYRDELADLLALLPKDYACHVSAFYWKARYIPHPRIHGAVGMKLAIISKYQITAAIRHQLALVPNNIVVQQFNPKRAILETHLPVVGAADLVVMNTHLEAYAQGTNTMQTQVAQVNTLLDKTTAAGSPWMIGGDFNLLPPGDGYARLSADQKIFYQPDSELHVLTDRFHVVPSLEDVNGPDYARWFTQGTNSPAPPKLDKTIDFIFYADKLPLVVDYVRQKDTLQISDHAPVIAEFKIP